jgi:hypothetical protein
VKGRQPAEFEGALLEDIPDIEGRAGELIDRLIAAVNSPQGSDWYEVAWSLVFAIGGEQLLGTEPDTGREPVPGSVGEELRRIHDVASRDEYFQMIGAQLMELTGSGLREDVLIRALRDELTRGIGNFVYTEEANSRRERTRENLEEWSTQADMIATYRGELAKYDSSASSSSDEEIAADLRSLAERFGPVPLETELGSWLRLDRWNERATRWLSDGTIDDWFDRYGERMIRDATGRPL